jgi:hypothetical protein
MSSTLISFIPILILLYPFLYRKKKKDLTFDIDYGIICYNCQEEIESLQSKIINMELRSEVKLCLACQREEKLLKITSNLPNFLLKNSIKRFLISDISLKILYTLLILTLSITVFDLILKLSFNVKILNNIGPIFNILYTILFIMKFSVKTQKTP